MGLSTAEYALLHNTPRATVQKIASRIPGAVKVPRGRANIMSWDIPEDAPPPSVVIDMIASQAPETPLHGPEKKKDRSPSEGNDRGSSPGILKGEGDPEKKNEGNDLLWMMNTDPSTTGLIAGGIILGLIFLGILMGKIRPVISLQAPGR